MGAGNTKTHYIQDAAEAWIVYLLQKLSVDNGTAITNNVEETLSAFVKHCKDKKIVKDFAESSYKKNIDAIVDNFYADIVKKNPNKKFDMVDVEKEFRDLGLKGDFIIICGELACTAWNELPKGGELKEALKVWLEKFSNDYTSFSLKNYAKGYNSIQLCSGTYLSFINNFVFVPDGVGMFVNPYTGERFNGSDRETRNGLLKKMGLSSLIPFYSKIGKIQEKMRNFYINDPSAKFFYNVEDKWKKDCHNYGHNAAKVISEAMKFIDNDAVKDRIMKMSGLGGDEELLLIGKGKYFTSWNDKYINLINRCKNATVEYAIYGKGLRFVLKDTDGDIIDIDVPMTLNANGAWYKKGLNEKFYGFEYKDKEGIDLAWAERRPKKSKEITTSINTYMRLSAAGIV